MRILNYFLHIWSIFLYNNNKNKFSYLCIQISSISLVKFHFHLLYFFSLKIFLSLFKWVYFRTGRQHSYGFFLLYLFIQRNLKCSLFEKNIFEYVYYSTPMLFSNYRRYEICVVLSIYFRYKVNEVSRNNTRCKMHLRCLFIYYWWSKKCISTLLYKKVFADLF